MKTTDKGPSGYGGGRRVVGRKHHIVVDTLGLMRALHSTRGRDQSGNIRVHIADSVGGRPTLSQLGWNDINVLWGRLHRWCLSDQSPLEDWSADHLGLWLVIDAKLEGQSTIVVLPKRWIVEITFACLMKCRRLVRDSEATTANSETWTRLAMIGLMLRRLLPN